MPDVHIINPDTYLQTPSGRWWTPERSKQAWSLAWQALETALSERAGEAPTVLIVCGLQGAGKSWWVADHAADYVPCVCFDAALPGARHRLPALQIAHRHGAKVIAVWIDTALEIALQRNALRSPDERVPEESICSVASLFEVPALAEGYVKVIRIKNDCLQR